jgi:hypothetical protein
LLGLRELQTQITEVSGWLKELTLTEVYWPWATALMLYVSSKEVLANLQLIYPSEIQN